MGGREGDGWTERGGEEEGGKEKGERRRERERTKRKEVRGGGKKRERVGVEEKWKGQGDLYVHISEIKMYLPLNS